MSSVVLRCRRKRPSHTFVPELARSDLSQFRLERRELTRPYWTRSATNALAEIWRLNTPLVQSIGLNNATAVWADPTFVLPWMTIDHSATGLSQISDGPTAVTITGSHHHSQGVHVFGPPRGGALPVSTLTSIVGTDTPLVYTVTSNDWLPPPAGQVPYWMTMLATVEIEYAPSPAGSTVDTQATATIVVAVDGNNMISVFLNTDPQNRPGLVVVRPGEPDYWDPGFVDGGAYTTSVVGPLIGNIGQQVGIFYGSNMTTTVVGPFVNPTNDNLQEVLHYTANVWRG
jgi:hypothetical protein